MNHRKIILLLTTILMSSQALACGDSLYRVGKGVTYRVHSAPLPGNLLVFAPSGYVERLAEQLAESGHGVQSTDSLDELQAELASGAYDMVIAPFAERSRVEFAAIRAKQPNAEFLPVATGAEEAKIASTLYDRVMVSGKHDLKHYLKAIHVALKRKA